MRRRNLPRLALAVLAASPALVAQASLPQPLLSQIAPAEAWLGEDVATDGALIAVSGVSNYVENPRVLVYEQVAGEWTVTKAWSPGGAAYNSGFGTSVDVDGDIVVAGAPDQLIGGRAWVLERVGGDWVQTLLKPPDQVAGQRFGEDVAVSDGRILVTHEYAGHAHVFEKLAGTWTAVAVLQPSVSDPSFGMRAALDGDRAVVAAPWEFDTQWGLSSAGAVYAFDFDGAVWSQTARLVSPVPAPGAEFGKAVDVQGDRLVAGVPGNGKGWVQPFRWLAGAWQPQPALQEPWPGNLAFFGRAVALDGARLLVGAGKGLVSSTALKNRMHLFEDAGAGFAHVVQFRGPMAAAEAVALSGDLAVGGIVPSNGNSRFEFLDLSADTWLDLGSAHPAGSAPPPRLYGFGSLQAGSSCSFEMEGSSSTNSLLGLFIAVDGPNPVPFHGGTLLATPVALFLTLPIGVVGLPSLAWELNVPFTMLPGLQGLDFVVQAAVRTTPNLELSNAIQGHVP